MSVPLYPSRHALEVMEARGVSWGQVVETVTHAEVSEPHQGRTRYHRGDLCVVVAPGGCVVTVLLRALVQWDDCDVRSRRGTPDLRPGRPGVSAARSNHRASNDH